MKTILPEMNAIDNANPSEALERLYCAGNLQLDYVLSDKHKEDYISVEQALLKAQEQEKVLKVIFEKNVNIKWFKHCIEENKTVEEYNNGMLERYEKLTQEEFDLLKRYCE